mmetsp:Transcript_20927/g.57581  ORF Transcript_20927/g.57581 Transcript_20927/m.57581 type:complete len:233 (-) Transcript_20927:492-1190(-)
MRMQSGRGGAGARGAGRAAGAAAASWLVMTSHRPSEAMTTKSRGPSSCSVRSGSWLRYCSIMTSPSALDMASMPMTRWQPMREVTVPPARWMRARSAGRLGLWSTDSATARPPTHATARLSPALATTTCAPRTRQHSAVLPSSHTRGPMAMRCCNIFVRRALSDASSWGNVLCSLSEISPLSPAHALVFAMASCRRCLVLGRSASAPLAMRAKSSWVIRYAIRKAAEKSENE